MDSKKPSSEQCSQESTARELSLASCQSIWYTRISVESEEFGVPTTASLRTYLLPKYLRDSLGSNSCFLRLKDADSIQSVSIYFKLAWLLKLHGVGQAYDNKLCNLTSYFRGLLGLLIRESRKLPTTTSMNFRYDSLSIKVDLDIFLNHFLDNLESMFGDSCTAFIPFVQGQSEASYVSTSPRELGLPVRFPSRDLQEVIDDIITAHAMRSGISIETLYNTFRALNLQLPYTIRVSICARSLHAKGLHYDSSQLNRIMGSLSVWLDSKSEMTRDYYEDAALIEFLHAAVFLETHAIDFEEGYVLATIGRALRHHNTFPCEIRKRILQIVLKSTDPGGFLAVSLRQAARTNFDIPPIPPSDIRTMVLRQRNSVY